jgi:Cu+-exporting ATPase
MGTFRIILTPDFMFYETAVMLAAFLTLGRYMEAGAKGRTSDSIRKLMELSAREAVVIKDGKEIRIPIESVAVDDVIMVRPGEKIPTDGVVIDGESYVDEAMVSGEPVPARKSEGSTVIGGTINKNSALKIRATRVGKDTLLSQIIDLVEQASGSRPPIQRLADRVVAYFIPVVIAVALGSFLIWYIVLKASLLYSLTAFISVLVVACPCALGLATPTAVTVGIGRGAELGILIKSGEALEAADRLTDIVYDKTGTLTIGRPMVTDILPINSTSTELLSIVAAAERPSEHPLASAVVTRARDEGIAIGEVSGFNEFPGKGVVADLLGAEIVVGNHAFMAERGLLSGDVEEGLMELERQGKTVVYAARSGQLKGAVAIADRLKDSARQAIAAQMRMGLGAAMVTGDNKWSAAFIASQIGISQVYAEVLPQDKAAIVETLQKKGLVVAFVGDGINDAPAMAQSELGIAIGSGTDIAIESSEIVLMRDDLNDVVASIQLSRKVMSRIRQNIFWAFAYNAALIPVAAGALWPLFGITFRPEMAGFAMALSSVTVVSLSLMLKRYTPEAKKALG